MLRLSATPPTEILPSAFERLGVNTAFQPGAPPPMAWYQGTMGMILIVVGAIVGYKVFIEKKPKAPSAPAP